MVQTQNKSNFFGANGILRLKNTRNKLKSSFIFWIKFFLLIYNCTTCITLNYVIFKGSSEMHRELQGGYNFFAIEKK